MKRIFFSIYLLILLLVSIFHQSFIIFAKAAAAQEVTISPNRLEYPRIGVYRKNFRSEITEIISEQTNSEIKLPTLSFEDYTFEGKSIELVCNASYPVIWRYSGHGAPAIRTVTYRKLISDVNLIYEFIATVVFTHTNAKQTGNYSCESVQDPQLLHSYIYVFVPGNALFLSDIEETETVIIDTYNPWVTLPCSVSDSDVTAILFKKYPTGKAEILKINENLIYDSKIGFQLKWTAFRQPTGLYYCFARNNRNVEQLEIQVEFAHKSNFKVDISNVPYWANQSSRKNVKFIIDRRNNRIVCCSTRNQRPSMKSTGCNSPSDCEIRRKYLEAKKCPPTCEQHIVNIGRTCVAFNLGEWRDDGILQCSSDNNKSTAAVDAEYFTFSKHGDTLITNFIELPPLKQILDVFIDDSPNPGKIYVSCHPHTFFFSIGIKWGVKRPGANFEFLPETHFPSPTTIEVEKEKYIGSEIYCFAPIWNSPTEWRNIAIFIK